MTGTDRRGKAATPAASPASALRRRAEEWVAVAPLPAAARVTDAKRLLHELQVHQVELEMQNEELRVAHAAVAAGLASYTALYEWAPVGYFTLDRDGAITQANRAAATLLGVERSSLPGQRLGMFVAEESRAALADFLARVAATDQSQACEITLAGKGRPPVQAWMEAGLTECGRAIRAVVSDISARKKAEQLQRQAEWARRHMAMQEDERRVLGAELHDRTSGNLAAMDLVLKNLAEVLPQPVPENMALLIEDLRALMTDTIVGTREIVANLRPVLLDTLGLAAALKSYALRFARRTGIATEVRVEVSSPLDTAIESVLFYISKEAMTNSAKHARPGKVRIELTERGDKLVLAIADDGVGFVPDESGVGLGMGLLTMRERAELAGGTFRIESSPGAGTCVTVEMEKT